MMPLTLADIGKTEIIKRVGGGEEQKRFLENLGFVPGSEITLVSKIAGNVIVNVKESRVAISEVLAQKIMV